MRYLAFAKLEIIRTIEDSHQPASQTLDMPGIPRTTFGSVVARVKGVKQTRGP